MGFLISYSVKKEKPDESLKKTKQGFFEKD